MLKKVCRKGSISGSGNVNWCNHFGEQYGDYFKKLKIELPYDPAILLLGIYAACMHPSVHFRTIYNSQDMEKNLNVHLQMNG